MLSKPVRKTKSGAPRGACASAPDLVFRTGSGVASEGEFPSFSDFCHEFASVCMINQCICVQLSVK